MKRTILLAITLTAGCASAPSPESQPTQSQPTQSQPTQEKQMSSLDIREINKAFQAGDGDAFASHYSPEAVMALSSGFMLQGQDALRSAATSSGPSVKRWDLEDIRTFEAKNATYVVGKSYTTLAKPDGSVLEVEGQRLLVRTGQVEVDLSLPGGAQPPDADWLARYQSLSDGWNNQTEVVADTFAADATSVLGDGSISRGKAAVQDTVNFAFGAKLRDMTVQPTALYLAGEDSAYVTSNYSFTFTPGDGPVTLSGCQVDLWKRGEDGWKIAVRVAQPKASSACIQ